MTDLRGGLAPACAYRDDFVISYHVYMSVSFFSHVQRVEADEAILD